MESSCFICGETIPKCSTLARGKIQNLKQLLTNVCKLLSVADIVTNDWDSVNGLEQSICCLACYDLLQNVGRVHEIIVKTERQLKTYLDHVESRVVKSQAHTQSLQNILWSPSCFVFRRRIIKKVTDSGEVVKDNLSPPVFIKEEDDFELGSDDDHTDHLEDSIDHWDSEVNGIDEEEEDPLSTENISTRTNENCNSKLLNVHDIFVKREASDDDDSASGIDSHTEAYFNLKKNPIKEKPTGQISSRPVQKRKIEITEEEVADSAATIKRRSSTRAAKRHAENALKQYVSNSASDDEVDDNPRLDSTFQVKNKSAATTPETEESEEEDDDDGGVDDESSNSKRTCKKPNWRDTTKISLKSFYPFVVAEENLYLFKWGTFVAFNYTHLQCKAYNCSFETAWDYYPSFQIMKSHIDDNHRSRKHRQQTRHPCILCNTMYKCQDEFRKHLKKAHKQFDLGRAKAICECCLMYTRHSYARTHLFSHKNDEEKAVAREAKDCSMRSYKPKESEMVEKKWICDYENCTSSFKSSRNLKRHKQVHLPKELRTDQTLCPECGQQILRECLGTHMRRVHHPETVDRVSICPICDKRFLPGDKANLQKHIRLHRGDKPFLCTECGKSYVGSAELTAHVNDVHREHGPLPCEWCDQVYTRLRSLQSHMKRKHPDNYVSKPSLKKKSKFYYKEDKIKADFIGPIQRFPCPICGTVCKYRSTLKKHVRTIHNNNKTDGGGHETRKVMGVQHTRSKGAPTRVHDGGLADVTTAAAHSSTQPNRTEIFPGNTSMLFPIQNMQQYFGFGH